MKSMTGFGRSTGSADDWQIEIEISSVNRKQFDLQLSLAPALQPLEAAIRAKVAEAASRGRVQMRISTTTTPGGGLGSRLDQAVAETALAELRAFAVSHGLSDTVEVGDLLRIPGIWSQESSPPDPETIGNTVLVLLDEALADFSAMQQAEGDHLASDMRERLALLDGATSQIRERAPHIAPTYREALLTRLEEAGLPVDLTDDRIVREIGLFADRSDITEELARLVSHRDQFLNYLESGEPVGRSLDFLCQEINRELNTIGSKANDAIIAKEVVIAKTELEKIREQVQNIQ
ncbi:MAG: YicC/YloC family endoribonuclease [Verrucomicrobiota bacterium]